MYRLKGGEKELERELERKFDTSSVWYAGSLPK